jgi:hypothetical protein
MQVCSFHWTERLVLNPGLVNPVGGLLALAQLPSATESSSEIIRALEPIRLGCTLMLVSAAAQRNPRPSSLLILRIRELPKEAANSLRIRSNGSSFSSNACNAISMLIGESIQSQMFSRVVTFHAVQPHGPDLGVVHTRPSLPAPLREIRRAERLAELRLRRGRPQGQSSPAAADEPPVDPHGGMGVVD